MVTDATSIGAASVSVSLSPKGEDLMHGKTRQSIAPGFTWRGLRSPSTPAYSTLLLNRVSPFQLSPMCSTGNGASILVIDDEPVIRKMVSDVLVSEGYLVWRAKDGVEALEVLDRTRPSLVILDMRMPVLDGWGFARVLRDRHLWLPVLVMTAAVNGQRWADDIGAAGCVTKPFDFDDLLAEVDRLIPPR